jgi:hypothetical protein
MTQHVATTAEATTSTALRANYAPAPEILVKPSSSN